MTTTAVRVVAAVIVREGRVLLTRRPSGTHLEGLWEFPGGKVEAGETDGLALARELEEELGIGTEVGSLFWETRHAYPEKTVHLLFYRATIVRGEPEPVQVAEVDWVDRGGLSTRALPPADDPLIELLGPELTE